MGLIVESTLAGDVAAAGPWSPQRFVDQGIAVEFSLAPADQANDAALREGEDAVLRFKISQAANGAPVPGLRPEGWLDRLPSEGAITPQGTLAKAQTFRQGGTFAKPYADLNVYYVLVLNEDNTISVVDPLFGFGGSKLLAYVTLEGRGEDWALSSDQRYLYVSMPETGAVAVVDTRTWKVEANIKVGKRPCRLALQPDQHYLWIGNSGPAPDATDDGVTVVAIEDHSIKSCVVKGRGPFELAFSEDSRTAFVLDCGTGTLSIVDVSSLRVVGRISVGKKPVGLDYCAKSGTAYVTDEESGDVTVIDARRRALLTTIKTESGLGAIKFPPNSRFGFVVNSQANLLHIIDSASNRVIETGKMEKEPYQINFSDRFAYIRDRQTATILMVPLDGIGTDGKRIPVVDFEGGQTAPSQARFPSQAPNIVQVPGENAVLIANERDKAVYYYEEGMAAAKGEFSDYGRCPRAVLPIDRSLRERSTPGVYETVLRLGEAGNYEVVFELPSPRLIKGFALQVQANPRLSKNGGLVAMPGLEKRVVKVGEQVGIDFKIVDEGNQQPKAKLDNLSVFTWLAPGVQKRRLTPVETAAGIYSVSFKPRQPGIYYIELRCDRDAVPLQSGQQLTLEAVEN
jgi:YVTN family beta-propeller protein